MIVTSELECFKKHQFRLSKHYKIMPLSHTSSFIDIENSKIGQQDLFGLLINKKNNNSRIINCQTALLLYVFQTPNHLPSYIMQDLDLPTIKDIKYMLSLSILEMKTVNSKNKRVEYISGPNALSYINKRASHHIVSSYSIQLDAIKDAYALLPLDHTSLASTLYRFNIKPVSKTLHHMLYDATKVKKFFKLDKQKDSKQFHNHWYPLEKREGWIGFINTKYLTCKNDTTPQAYKLYLSPETLTTFQAIFFEVSQLLYRANAFQFKIGDNAYGLQRPDKWVAYFYDKASLYTAIHFLEQQIGNIKGQQVPFSGKCNSQWLSWGRDPKQIHKKSISWRWLVCSEIAHALLELSEELQTTNSIEDVWSHITSRLERENINPNTFEPME